MTASPVTPDSQPSVADELCIQLRDLVQPLGFVHHQHAIGRFKTFASKFTNSPKGNLLPFKPDIYTDSVSWRITDTFVMTRSCAMSFACWVDPERGLDLMLAMNAAKQEPAPIPYFTEKSVNCRLLAERYNRSIDSVKRTFARNREWIKEIGGSELHIEERGGELWFTEQYAACLAFGGGKNAVLVKAKTMVTYADNPMAAQDKLQPLLRLV